MSQVRERGQFFLCFNTYLKNKFATKLCKLIVKGKGNFNEFMISGKMRFSFAIRIGAGTCAISLYSKLSSPLS